MVHVVVQLQHMILVHVSSTVDVLKELNLVQALAMG